MNSILLVIKSNLKRRKIQNLAIGISMAIAALMFSCSIGILLSMQAPFDQVFNKLNASHLVLNYDFRSENSDSMTTWFARLPEVERVGKPTPYVMCNGPLYFKDEKLDMQVQITEYTPDHLIQDKLEIMHGAVKDHPEDGEIWLPNYLFLRHQIQIGDSVAIPASGGVYRFKVAAAVSDPQYGSGMVNPTRAWVGPGSISFFVPVSQITNNCLGIRLKSPVLTAAVSEQFNRKFHFSGVVLQYDIFKSAFMSMYQIIGGILFIFSLLFLFISVFIVYNAISKNIHDDHKMTGVLKTLGFTPVNTTSVQVAHYFLLTLVFIPAGFAGTFYILQFLLQSVANTIGGARPDINLFPLFSIAGIALMLITLLVSLTAGLKSAKIRPAEAIRYGSPERKNPTVRLKGMIGAPFLPLLMTLGLKFSLEDRKRTALVFIMLMSTVFVLTFSINIAASLSALKENKAAWGFERGDIQLNRNQSGPIGFTHLQFEEILRQEKGIKAVASFGYENLTVMEGNGHSRLNLFGKAYGADVDNAGLTYLSGSNPANENEIALCVGTANILNKRPGDSLSVFMEGEKIRYRISGIYQDISNMGQGFRILAGAMATLNPVFEPNTYSLQLTTGTSKDDFKAYLLHKFGSTIAIETSVDDRLEQMGVISEMKAVFTLLSLFFITMLFLSIWNDVVISIRDYRKIFGILKTAGFTPRQLRRILPWKILLPSLLALIMGIPLSLWLSPLLMSQVTKTMGLVHFPFMVDPALMLLLPPLFLFSVLLFAWLASSGTTRVNPRMLINE
jgi:putative ABC transport system permease protein